MRARSLAFICALAALIVAAPAAAADDWLGEINRYRDAAAVPAIPQVIDNPTLDAALAAHLYYLQHDTAYETGQYASPHTENPAAPDYTPDGATEGLSSDIAIGSPGVLASGTAAIDAWWESPFHAIGMLRPRLSSVALALAPNGGAAALDIFNGLEGGSGGETSAVLFPGNGVVTNLSTYSGSEFPDPTTPCGSHSGRWGLPLIALLPAAPAAGLTATLTGPAGTQSPCVVDQNTFSSDPTGQEILAGDHAVVLIPGAPLAKGGYAAVISQPGLPAVSWSFSEGTVPAAAPVTGTPTAPTAPTAPSTPAAPTEKPAAPTATGTGSGTGTGSATGTSSGAATTTGTRGAAVSLVAHHARLALRGRGAATITVTASRHGRRLAHRTFHEHGGSWLAALTLPRRLRGRMVTVTVRVSAGGHTAVLHRHLRV